MVWLIKRERLDFVYSRAIIREREWEREWEREREREREILKVINYKRNKGVFTRKGNAADEGISVHFLVIQDY